MRRSVAKAQGIAWRPVRPVEVKVKAGTVVVQEIVPPTRWQIVKAWWKSWFR